ANFYKLGWDGEIKNISNSINIEMLNNKEINYFIDFLFKKCDYFGTSNYPSKSCEVFESINLNSQEKGYIIRKIPLQEDDNFIFFILIPFIMIYGIILSLSFDFFSLYLHKELFIALIISFLSGFIILKLLIRYKMSKKQQHYY
ncbi:MAG: hypothetical protein NZM02_00040, partial [Patescibacteria group bacterium]|nr:hypothetical protein [Patescibacteria group bacterium]